MSAFNRKVARNDGTRVFRSYQHEDIFYLFSLFEDVHMSLYIAVNCTVTITLRAGERYFEMKLVIRF